jgi:hypothetical protein
MMPETEATWTQQHRTLVYSMRAGLFSLRLLNQNHEETLYFLGCDRHTGQTSPFGMSWRAKTPRPAPGMVLVDT